jgi:hypothetical protein
MNLQSYDVTFKIINFNIKKDILVVKCWSPILKRDIDYYNETNIGCQWFEFNKDYKKQIIEKCKSIIEQYYLQEQLEDFLNSNINIPITGTNIAVNEFKNTEIKFI